MNTKTIYQTLCVLLLSSILFTCNGQTTTQNLPATNKKVVGGPFENAEFFYIGMPKNINAIDTSAAWQEKGQKLLITGIIYKNDGKTPAPNVILYYYQTNTKGYYANKPGLDKRVIRHGYIRGWVKSDKDGRYAIYTIRPAAYPDQSMPAHVHPAIKEPNLAKEYYIDEFVFDDDKLLTSKYRNNLENRGGSGVLRLYTKGNLQIAEHNIILGLNIPNYPIQTKNISGLQVGEDQPSFTPFHAYGPDKGSTACPVCKYGRYHGIIYFIGNKPNWLEIKNWLLFLENESAKRGKYLKVYFVYGNNTAYDKTTRQIEIEKIGRELNIKHVALTFVPSLSDKSTEVFLNRINENAVNTFVIYRNRTIIVKYINLAPTLENFKMISTLLDKTKSKFVDFELNSH